MAFLLSQGNVIYDGQIVAPRRVLAEFQPALSPGVLAQIAGSLDATQRPVGGAVSFDDECVSEGESTCLPNPFSATTTPMTGGH